MYYTCSIIYIVDIMHSEHCKSFDSLSRCRYVKDGAQKIIIIYNIALERLDSCSPSCSPRSNLLLREVYVVERYSYEYLSNLRVGWSTWYLQKMSICRQLISSLCYFKPMSHGLRPARRGALRSFTERAITISRERTAEKRSSWEHHNTAGGEKIN